MTTTVVGAPQEEARRPAVKIPSGVAVLPSERRLLTLPRSWSGIIPWSKVLLRVAKMNCESAAIAMRTRAKENEAEVEKKTRKRPDPKTLAKRSFPL